MKRFDKGYIYCGLLSDLFSCLVILFIFTEDFFFGEETKPEDIRAAIPFFAIGFAVIFLCFVIYRILYYRASGYELTETEIRCKRGVLFKKNSVLDYKKIHAINKRQNIFQRIFGIAVLTIDSGSTNTSHQAEITIIEKNAVADALLRELDALKENGVREGESEAGKEEILLSEEDSLYRFTSGKKMLYTLINILSTVFFTALIAVLATVTLGICKIMLKNEFLGTWGQYFFYAVMITVGAMLLFSLVSFVRTMLHSFVGYYGFNITKRDNNVQITYGFFDKHTNTFSYDRIKAVKISQSFVQRILGFATVKLEVIGYTAADSGENNANAEGILVPFCKYDETDEILGKILPDYIPSKKQTAAVSFFPFVSWFLLIFGIVSAVLVAGTVAVMTVMKVSSAIVSAVALAIVFAAALVILLKLVSALLCYRTNGIATNGKKITVYSGGFTKNVTVFMAKNLIAVEDVTTPLRKKKGISSLVMHLKTNALSNEIKVHIQKDSLSDELEKMLTL